MMAAFGDVLPFARARRRSISARVKPAPKAPILRKLRREMPSQKRCRDPQIVSIVVSLSPEVTEDGGDTSMVLWRRHAGQPDFASSNPSQPQLRTLNQSYAHDARPRSVDRPAQRGRSGRPYQWRTG